MNWESRWIENWVGKINQLHSKVALDFALTFLPCVIGRRWKFFFRFLVFNNEFKANTQRMFVGLTSTTLFSSQLHENPSTSKMWREKIWQWHNQHTHDLLFISKPIDTFEATNFQVSLFCTNDEWFQVMEWSEFEKYCKVGWSTNQKPPLASEQFVLTISKEFNSFSQWLLQNSILKVT